MKKSISRNYIYNMFFNILIVITPLVTTPYVSRVLGAESIGIYTYCLSISLYFIAAGTLGMPAYGQREVAKIREDGEKLNILFSELFYLQSITMSAALFLYCCLIYFWGKYNTVFLACGIGVFAAIFDLKWLFTGLEEFKTTVFRNSLIKIISVICIFVFVHSPDDTVIYTAVLMGANLIGNIWLFLSARKHVSFVRIKIIQLTKHLKPVIYLTLPTTVVSIYSVINRTMLGSITGNMAEVGYYEQAQKVITIALISITSLGAVIMPRIANLFGNKVFGGVKRLVNKGLDAVVFIACPMAAGCVAVAGNLVPWFYGAGYDKVRYLLLSLSPLFLLSGCSDLFGTRLMLAVNKERRLLFIIIISLLINCVLNFLLIPKYLCYGVAGATLVGEIIKYIFCLYESRDAVDIKKHFTSLLKYAVPSLVMGAVLFAVQAYFDMAPTILNSFALIISGGALYFGFMLLVRNYWALYCVNKAAKLFKLNLLGK